MSAGDPVNDVRGDWEPGRHFDVLKPIARPNDDEVSATGDIPTQLIATKREDAVEVRVDR